MWIVKLALRRPYTFVVMALLILLLGVSAIKKTPTDIFLSMISPAPIPAHRSEASRLQGMGANLALPAHWNLPTQN
jgi:hypothetical protein